jgi:hypothetical protein
MPWRNNAIPTYETDIQNELFEPVSLATSSAGFTAQHARWDPGVAITLGIWEPARISSTPMFRL